MAMAKQSSHGNAAPAESHRGGSNPQAFRSRPGLLCYNAVQFEPGAPPTIGRVGSGPGPMRMLSAGLLSIAARRVRDDGR